ncbi:MAG: glycosyltransferase family 2 protein [Casimicrobiaceae bacterium]
MSAHGVSVIVRSMARATLPRTLASIAAQDVALEVLLVAASGAAHPPPASHVGAHPLRFIASTRRLDRGAAANAGLDAARGEWVTWLDDDDQWLPGHLRGLLAAAATQPSCAVVHSLAQVQVDGEDNRTFGQPMAPSELYVRNFLHASATLVARSLVGAGCRCDEAMQLHEDWDWFLQCAQHTRFHYVHQRTFVWNAGIGESGAGSGRNFDARKVEEAAAVVRRKWEPLRQRLFAELGPVLQRMRAAAERRDWTAAGAEIEVALAINPNDPVALAVRSAAERAQGNLVAAQATAALASIVRPYDATLVYNLALICRQRGDEVKLAGCKRRLAQMAAQDPRATALCAQLDGN